MGTTLCGLILVADRTKRQTRREAGTQSQGSSFMRQPGYRTEGDNVSRSISKNNFLAMMRASKLLVILAMMTMMFWTTGTAGATVRDIDNDGLTNSQERNLTHTNPHKADTDGDHIRDGNEDSDHDGVDNTNEQNFSTNMADPDSDNDGEEDGDEDSDSDGTDNEDEDDGANSADQCATGVEDDADEDSDSDDLDDEDEDDFGEEQNDSDTDGDGTDDGDEDEDGDGNQDGDEDDQDEDDDCDGVEDENDDDQGEDEQ